jgi:hypothetical protein
LDHDPHHSVGCVVKTGQKVLATSP